MAALRKLGAPFAVIGGVALDAYQQPRATKDVDFLLYIVARAETPESG